MSFYLDTLYLFVCCFLTLFSIIDDVRKEDIKRAFFLLLCFYPGFRAYHFFPIYVQGVAYEKCRFSQSTPFVKCLFFFNFVEHSKKKAGKMTTCDISIYSFLQCATNFVKVVTSFWSVQIHESVLFKSRTMQKNSSMCSKKLVKKVILTFQKCQNYPFGYFP